MDIESSSSYSNTVPNPKKQSSIATPMDDENTKNRRNKRCCIITLTVLITFALVFSILGATLFKAKKPITTVNQITLKNFDVSFDALRLKVHLNLSLNADVSVKNPNRVGLTFTDSSAYLNYKGQVVGQAPIPANKISAGGILPMNLTLTIMADKFLDNSQAVISDLISGSLPLSTNTRISGKVVVLFFKVHVVSYASCNMNISVSSRSISNSDCTYKTRLL